MSVGLDVRGLGVRYGEVPALHDVSLAATGGDFIAVTGPSGAGKTTLLWAIAQAVTPAAGEVRLDGTPLRDHDDALAQGVVLIPQGSALAVTLTAYENVLVPLVARGVTGAQARERALAALAAVGLAESGTHRAEELSGGQQQRTAVARGLAQQGRILLADEPTSELDHDNRERVLALLRQQADAGALVLMTTHDLEAAEAADRVLHLDEGALAQ
ncbi:MAG: ATP-binding cassette domain-containing protein [Micrococcales bacterium]|nr:ATP-binding cassette domain-containing protein [Micrococcales bacterium]